MNITDSERISAVLENLGFVPAKRWQETDLFIMNSCSVRQKPEDRVHGLIGDSLKIKKKNKKFMVGLTGCMVRKSSTQNSELKDNLLKVHENLDFVFRIEDLCKLDQVLRECKAKLKIKPLEDEGTVENYFKIQPKYSNNFSAFVPIQTGCDKFCTYCIVPFARGREYSRDFVEVLAECGNLVEKGVKEITLVGQTVNTYGISRADKMSKKFEKYGKYPFVKLLEEIDKLQLKGLKWLRFTSPYPKDFSDELMEAMARLKTLCHHVHMPIQSGSDAVLQMMNRQYSVKDYLKLVNKFRKKIPDIAISTDIIVGFAGETEAMFKETCALYDKIQWEMCYHAKYSSRKGTYAGKILKDNIFAKAKSRRWHKLNEYIKKYSFKALKGYANSIQEVLVDEKKQDGLYYGRNFHNKLVCFKSRSNLIGKFVCVRITQVKEWLMEGKLLNK
ncbi:tRNA (N6-isopentenyl adenosine(37)-C2)-methylthiotransferase MiaB [Candidatus Peregrinibacteria bacterium RIFOXYA12_FULL_33_12]|nr:MAG: tRNA (N6-isopentenyl adenosine(37)-C2)-methylthiotransferase MiaB [Candidatus Peregrinibacteria bacterium RIFOXYA12_FULL_33_12]OGJ44171.1 MAG: tRNA (N6-isopentenyl adenosine(37)-C2)-methylthiotransferase MiaB [Candidatus Peregrinibacteria bacterium RIFOXYA2_FULL_33_21]OGJ51800.1 MAG: tRNA (N6-isopentenyl adenosine(37)-C2)-methylthiotransferase MiaB [Candidatus Peregrinibacteria bacterium RIFOXYB2_FULL_33_20]